MQLKQINCLTVEWIELLSYTWQFHNLVPRPPPFLPSICVHYNTCEQKSGEKRGTPGSIHHVGGREVHGCRGEGPIFKYVRTKLESEFLTSQDEQFWLC